MKKLVVTSLSILALLGHSYGQTNEVSSVNAVGYMKLQLPAGGNLYMGGVNLKAVNGADHIGVRELFGTNQLKRDDSRTRCDLVYIWEGTKYSTIGQKADTYFYDASTAATWGSNNVINPLLANGTAFWVKPQGSEIAKTIYIMGGVPTDPLVTNSIAGNGTATRPLNFMANPFPVSVDITNLIVSADGAVADDSVSRCDWIQLWSGAGYIKLGLKADNKWYQIVGSAFVAGPATNNTIEPGKGFWYQTKGTGFQWVEAKPYTWPN